MMRGRNVHGWASMHRYRYAPSGVGRVGVLGPSAPAPSGPILPPEAAPSLDGPAAAYAYAGRRLLTDFSSIGQGDLERSLGRWPVGRRRAAVRRWLFAILLRPRRARAGGRSARRTAASLPRLLVEARSQVQRMTTASAP